MKIFWRSAVIVVLILVISFILARARAAQDPRPRAVGAPVFLSFFTVQPKHGPSNEPVNMLAGIEWAQVQQQASGELKVEIVGSTQIDLMTSNGSVIVGDTLFYDKECAAIIEAIAMREYRDHFPSAMPQRKGVRSGVPQSPPLPHFR